MRFLLSITILLCAITAHSQTFLDNLRSKEAGQGTVTVVQSPAIDSLVNGIQREGKTPTEQPSGAIKRSDEKSSLENKKLTDTHDTPRKSPTDEKTAPSLSHGIDDTSLSETESPVIDTRKKVMRNSYKMQGYRIQVYSGGNSRADRQKAEQAGADMKLRFPQEPIYVHFYSPSWKCRMGNYKTIEEARALLPTVKSMGYQHACIVKGTISVQY